MAGLIVEIGAKIGGLLQGLNGARQAVAGFAVSTAALTSTNLAKPFDLLGTAIKGVKVDGLVSGISKAVQSVSQLSSVAKTVGTSLSTGEIAGAFQALTAALAANIVFWPLLVAGIVGAVAAIGMLKAAQASDEITRIAEASGLAVTELMGLEHAFARAGIKLTELPAITGQFRMGMESLKDPTSRVSLALKQLNLGQKDFVGKTQIQSFYILSAAIDKAKESGKGFAAASALFGQEKGGKMANVLTPQALQDSMAKTNPVAGVFQEMGPVFLQIGSAVSMIFSSVTSFFGALLGEIAPLILAFVKAFTGMRDIAFEIGKALGQAVNFVASWVMSFKDDMTGVIIASLAGAFIGALNLLGAGLDAIFKKIHVDIKFKPFENNFVADEVAKINAITQKRKEQAKEESINPSATPVIQPVREPMALQPIVSSLTKMGGGAEGWGANAAIGIQREQLLMQTRMANGIEKIVSKSFTPLSNPLIGITPNFATVS